MSPGRHSTSMGGAILPESCESGGPTEPEHSAGLPLPRRYAAIVAVSLATMVASIDNGSVNIALPTLARDLHIEPSAAVLVVTVFQLILIMVVLPASALADRLGHRKLFQYGQVVFMLASVLCLFAQSLPVLILIRVLQALGIAATSSVSSAMIRSIYPQARLGSGISINTIIAATSASIAPTIGGLILGVANWRWLFCVTVPLSLLSIVIGRKALPTPKRRTDPYDVVAALLCAAMFGLAIVGLESATRSGASILSAGLIVLAAVVGVTFFRRERGQVQPILPVDLLRQRLIALSSLATLFSSLGSMTVLLTLPFRLQHNLGYSPAETGLVMGAWPVVMMAAAPASGMLSDRISAGLLGSIGMAIAILGMTSLAFLPTAPTHLDLIWRLALAGLGYGIFTSPNARLTIASAPMARAASAGALSLTTRMIGLVLGSIAAAVFLATEHGAASTPPLFAAALAVLSGLCSLAVLRTTGRSAASLALQT